MGAKSMTRRFGILRMIALMAAAIFAGLTLTAPFAPAIAAAT